MSSATTNFLLLAGTYLLLFAIAELLYHKFKVAAEITRKIVHVITGVLALLFPLLLNSHWLVLLLCASFLVILLVSLRFNFLPSINAVYRVTQGSILFPVVVYGCYVVYHITSDLTFYYLPILTLSVADPMAAFVGKKWPWKPYEWMGKSNTVSGSMAFFGSAVVIGVLILMGLEAMNVSAAVLCALVMAVPTTLSEATTCKGYDNLSIPVASVISLYLIHATGWL